MRVIPVACSGAPHDELHRPLRTRRLSATPWWRFAAVGLAWAAALGGCATPRATAGGLAGVDVVLADGSASSLASLAGHVVVLDLCASWADACPLNARALDLTARELAADAHETEVPVAMITVLLDEPELKSIDSYARVFELHHTVVRAGPRTRSGASLLGPVTGVPRLLLIDAKGDLVVDESGGVLSPSGLATRIRGLPTR